MDGGIPIKLIRYRFDESARVRLLAEKWWERPADEVTQSDFCGVERALALLLGMTGPQYACVYKGKGAAQEDRRGCPLLHHCDPALT